MTYQRLLTLGTLGVLSMAACSSATTPVVDPTPAAQARHAHEDLHELVPVVTAGQSAPSVARSVMSAWSRRDRTYGAWWRALSPLLSSQGRQDYAYTDPASIPRLRVVGAPRLLDSTATAAVVAVPTTLGRFTVLLTRQAATTGWLAERLGFPPTSSDPR